MRIKDRLNREEGAAAVEFALVSILLFTLLFAIINFGLVLHRYQVYEGAAREGARYAAVRCVPDTSPCTAGEVAQRVKDAAAGWELTNTPTADKTCTDQNAGQEVTVQWDQNLQLLNLPLVPPITSNVTIKGVFRCE